MSSLKNFELDYKSLKKSAAQNNNRNNKDYSNTKIEYSYNIKGSNKTGKRNLKHKEKEIASYSYNPEYIDQRTSYNKKIYKNKYNNENIVKKIITHTYYGIFFLVIVGFLFFLTISSGFAKSKNIGENGENKDITFEKHIEDIKNDNDIYDNNIFYTEAEDYTNIKNNRKVNIALKESVIPINFKKYRVKQGDTLTSIAKQHDIIVDSIILSNNIKKDILKVGSIILIPNQDGRLITLKETESIYTLANKYNVKAEDIAYSNDLRAEKISSGSEVFIPLSRMSNSEKETFYGINKENNKTNNKTIESIEKEFNILQTWPVKGQITSHFGERVDPFNEGIKKVHDGIDIKNKHGTPVCAFRDGIAEEVVLNDPVYGNYVILKHKNGYKSKYAHLNEIMVEKGNNIRVSQVIGTVGSTGRSTGDHLHFEITKNGVFINPLTILN